MIKIFINEVINNKGEQLPTEKMQLPIFSKDKDRIAVI